MIGEFSEAAARGPENALHAKLDRAVLAKAIAMVAEHHADIVLAWIESGGELDFFSRMAVGRVVYEGRMLAADTRRWDRVRDAVSYGYGIESMVAALAPLVDAVTAKPWRTGVAPSSSSPRSRRRSLRSSRAHATRGDSLPRSAVAR